MKNNKINKVLSSVSYTMIANIISLVISLITILILPRFMAINQYAYWQLYLFYCSYVVFISVGWCDGVYLRYGGYKYKDLPKDKFVTQFWTMIAYLCCVTIIMVIFIYNFDLIYDKKIVFYATFLYGVVYIGRVYFEYILQATNRIKTYAKIVLIDRISFLFMILILVTFKVANFKFLILTDLIIKFITLLYAIYKCRRIAFGKFVSLKINIKETYDNISVGIKLTFANLAGILIVGIVRSAIENVWSVEMFGKISLTLSLNNMILVCVNAIGVVIFPILCRTSKEHLPKIYNTLKVIITVLLFGGIAIYYPIKNMLLLWLPQYGDSLKYMALLFPMCVFESKMSLIINPYLKAVRKENKLLYINLITVALSIIVTFINVNILKNINLTILSITFLIIFRTGLAEILSMKTLKIKESKQIVLDILMAIIFINVSWNINSLASVIIYIIIYVIYLILNISNIKRALIDVKTLIK